MSLFDHWSGPKEPRILMIGEAWGESENELKLPFVGFSGKELWRVLGEVWNDVDPKDHGFVCSMFNSHSLWTRERERWLDKARIAFTNVFNERPPDNNLEAWQLPKKELPNGYALPPMAKNKYLNPSKMHHLRRLYEQIDAANPDLIVALGNVPLWALFGEHGIGKFRGTVQKPPSLPCKILATYHPAAILRQWSWRPILVADMMKAKRVSLFREVRRPPRRVLINPTLAELALIEQKCKSAQSIAVDVETAGGFITMVGFAISKSEAFVIPFFEPLKADGSYWPNITQELYAWGVVQRILNCPAVKIFQNGLYDIQYFWRTGLTVANATEDTMLLHHSLFPEMQKSLGFMGSIYTDESAWKLMRNKTETEELKRDE